MTAASLKETLQKHPFVANFCPEHLDKLAAIASHVHFNKDELVFQEGEESRLFYLLLSGSVALEVPTPGRTVRVATVGFDSSIAPGSLRVDTVMRGAELGWSSIFPAPHMKQFQARTLEEVDALRLDGEQLRQMCEVDHDFGYMFLGALLRVMANRLQGTRIQLKDVYSPSASAA